MNFTDIFEKYKKEESIGKSIAPEKTVEGEIAEVPPGLSEVNLMELLPIFGLDSLDQLEPRGREMLEYIYSQLNSSDKATELIKYENRIGTPQNGVTRIRHIYNSMRFGYGVEASNSEGREDPPGNPGGDVQRAITVSIKL